MGHITSCDGDCTGSTHPNDIDIDCQYESKILGESSCRSPHRRRSISSKSAHHESYSHAAGAKVVDVSQVNRSKNSYQRPSHESSYALNHSQFFDHHSRSERNSISLLSPSMTRHEPIDPEQIKQHVHDIYDIPETPLLDDTFGDTIHTVNRSELNGPNPVQYPLHETVGSASNLLREQSDEHWSTMKVIKMSQEMSAELEHQISVHNLRVYDQFHSVNSSGVGTSDVSRSESTDSESEVDVRMRVNIEGGIGLESPRNVRAAGLESPKNVFRAHSGQEWTEREIDTVKSDMAKQLVHLQLQASLTSASVSMEE